MDPNPYAAPTAPVDAPTRPEAAPPLWNPNAAAGWSLLFSPAFGAFLQMRNWRALGDEARAQQSWYWVLGSIGFILALTVLGGVLPENHPLQRLTNLSGLALLLAWYFSLGKQQVTVVAQRFGKDYPRKTWGAPLGIAVAAVVAYLVAMVVLGVVLALLGVVDLGS